MPYASLADLAALGLPPHALAGVEAADQYAALEAASALVDSYLRGRYPLPLLSWGRELTRVTAIIAAYDLMSRRGYDPNRPGDENLRLRYEDAIRWLEGVAAGRIDPQVGVAPPDEPGGAVWAKTSSRRWP